MAGGRDPSRALVYRCAARLYDLLKSSASKSAIIAELVQEAVAREQRRRGSRVAGARIRARRAEALARSNDEIRASREQGRS